MYGCFWKYTFLENTYIIHCNSNLTTLQSCCLNHTLAMLILVLQRYPNTSLQCWLHRHMVSCCNGLFMVWFHRLFNDCLQTYLLVWWVCPSQCWGPVKNGKKMIFCNFFSFILYFEHFIWIFFFFINMYLPIINFETKIKEKKYQFLFGFFYFARVYWNFIYSSYIWVFLSLYLKNWIHFSSVYEFLGS